jgi:hypothetical protein
MGPVERKVRRVCGKHVRPDDDLSVRFAALAVFLARMIDARTERDVRPVLDKVMVELTGVHTNEPAAMPSPLSVLGLRAVSRRHNVHDVCDQFLDGVPGWAPGSLRGA